MSNEDQSLIEFPCQFPIKAMGRADIDLKTHLVKIAEKNNASFSMQQITETTSRTGKYVSLTITITAISQQQLDAIYQELSASEHFLMVL